MTAAVVSIVMPVYNADKYLQKSIDSVLGQTHRAFELIAVDDCSSDRSWEILQSCAAADSRVKAIRLDVNGGVAAARNAGIAVALGSHMAFLDSDDWWDPHKLEMQLSQMTQTGASVSYTTYDRVGIDGALLSCVRPPATVSFSDMLKSNRIGHSTGMYARSLGDVRFQTVGHEDYVFWLEVVRRAGAAVRAGDTMPLAWYLVRSGSLSSDKWKAARWQWHIYRDILKLRWLSSVGYMFHYVWHAVRKRR
jgi:glycosyltransferase involved in cell wall biosynthesis